MTSRSCCCYRFLCLKKIGEGRSANVYQLFYKDGVALRLALKLFKKEKMLKCFKECNMLQSLAHDNVVKCFGEPVSIGGKCFFLMEMMAKRSLQLLYESRKLEEDEIRLFTWQLLKAVQHIHAKSVVHRDIKCANCLIGEANNLKLGDFGIAEELRGKKATRGISLSAWAAPEVSRSGDEAYGKEADVWSVGCTMLEMFLRSPPRKGHGNSAIPCIPTDVHGGARRVIERCLVVNPSSRPTVAELLNDEYFQGIESNCSQSFHDDPGTAGLVVFDESSHPPFLKEASHEPQPGSLIEQADDTVPTSTIHSSSCCMNRDKKWQDQRGSDNVAKLAADHSSSCCIHRAKEWEDQQGVRSEGKLEGVDEFFGRVPRRASTLPCVFVNLME